ncbi:MAG TPA: hypothetical protein VM925_36635, partial [Labilithrix sp.]|nr:hypothetical protein [Labilithrix sp.]
MPRPRLAALLALGWIASCGGDGTAPTDRHLGEPASPPSPDVPPRASIVPPEIPDVRTLDRDGNRVDDVFDDEGISLREQLTRASDPA